MHVNKLVIILVVIILILLVTQIYTLSYIESRVETITAYITFTKNSTKTVITTTTATISTTIYVTLTANKSVSPSPSTTTTAMECIEITDATITTIHILQNISVQLTIMIKNLCDERVYVSRVYVDNETFSLNISNWLDPGETLSKSGYIALYDLTDPVQASKASWWESGTQHEVVVEYSIGGETYTVSTSVLVQ